MGRAKYDAGASRSFLHFHRHPVRPTAKVFGLSGDWIASHGLALETTTSVLERFPIIRLLGPADYTRLLKIPAVVATIEADTSSQTAPASFRRLGSDYEIVVDTSSLHFPATEHVSIQLNFDSFFVPKKKGANKTVQELVVKKPRVLQLLRK